MVSKLHANTSISRNDVYWNSICEGLISISIKNSAYHSRKITYNRGEKEGYCEHWTSENIFTYKKKNHKEGLKGDLTASNTSKVEDKKWGKSWIVSADLESRLLFLIVTTTQRPD